MIKKYVFNVLIGFDLFVNTIFGGDPYQTISGRVYAYRNGNCIARLVYKFLDWLQPNHCESAYLEAEKGTNGSDAVLK